MHDDEDERDESPEDNLAIMRAEIDQVVAVAPEIARVAAGWFNAFQSAGFNEKQALYLAAAEILQNPGTAPS